MCLIHALPSTISPYPQILICLMVHWHDFLLRDWHSFIYWRIQSVCTYIRWEMRRNMHLFEYRFFCSHANHSNKAQILHLVILMFLFRITFALGPPSSVRRSIHCLASNFTKNRNRRERILPDTRSPFRLWKSLDFRSLSYTRGPLCLSVADVDPSLSLHLSQGHHILVATLNSV